VLNDLVARILAIAGILESSAELKLSELKAQYPDTQTAVDKFLEWVKPQLEVVLDPQTAAGLLAKVAAELASGHPGYDNRHWVIP
jgi:hypothetical protein